MLTQHTTSRNWHGALMFTPVEDTIQSGSHVIVYSSRVQLDSIFVVPGQEIHSKFGHFRHNDMINVPYGSKVTLTCIGRHGRYRGPSSRCPLSVAQFSSANGRGFMYLLKPTPELWRVRHPRMHTKSSKLTIRFIRQDTGFASSNSNSVPARHRFHHLVP